jgi:hypothetical protein
LSGPDFNQTTGTKTTLPALPWQIEAVLPTHDFKGYSLLVIDTKITRSINGHQEVWIIQYLSASESGYSNKNVFQVYQTDSREWKTVSADIQDSGFFVEDLFVTSDGSLWGQTVWDTTHGWSGPKRVPVLSKFNETTRRFEFANNVLEIPWVLFSYSFFPWPEIVLDQHDIFWIFAKNDGIYRYDPAIQKTEKQADRSDLNVTQTALSPDGRIYFEIYSEKIYSKESFFRLSDGMLFEFHPDTKVIIPLDVPDGTWPVFAGMLVDHKNRLWLGAIGYREPNGQWTMVYPNPQEYFEHAGDMYWAPPGLILESSDGILWYKKFLDDSRVDSTAWYNPETGEGCMFTNLAVNIIEDSEKKLWLVADGKLYKYEVK